jgi:hypothetical protein
VRRISIVFVALLSLAGCQVTKTSAAPPTVVCGTTLSTSAAGPVVDDLRRRDRVQIAAPSVGGLIFLRLTGCDHGADVTIIPSTAVVIAKTAPATDGKPAAVVLRPVQAVPTIVEARQHGRTVGSALISLDRLPP